jgi:large subunit ribosomal protein L4
VMATLAGESTVLLLIPDKSEAFGKIAKSAGNLASTKVLNANYLNIRDLLGYDKIVVPVEALEIIRSYLG